MLLCVVFGKTIYNTLLYIMYLLEETSIMYDFI